MTREAKIGMLTGLGVIVLIGVLLSEYLGGGAGHAMSPTGRMAELPMGAAYRQEVTDPVGVPGMARTDGASAAAAAPETVTASAGNLPTGSPSMPELPKGTNDGTGAPAMGDSAVVGQPVSPVQGGQARNGGMTTGTTDGSVPTLQLGDSSAGSGTQAVYTQGQSKPTMPGPLLFTDGTSAPVKGQEYVVAPGDTLTKIAAKFYKNSKSDGVRRIVAANPTVLKDDKSMLVAGKKLIIPAVAAAPKAAAPVAAAAVTKKPAAVVIHPPGTATPATTAGTSTADAPKPAATKVYVVQAGDTLEKIAKRVSPSNVNETVKKIEAANGITDPTGLKVGAKLKLPVA